MAAIYPDFKRTDSQSPRNRLRGQTPLAPQPMPVARLHRLSGCFQVVFNIRFGDSKKVIRTDSFSLGKNHLFAVSCPHRGQKNRGA
jgi:hypothetical protein